MDADIWKEVEGKLAVIYTGLHFLNHPITHVLVNCSQWICRCMVFHDVFLLAATRWLFIGQNSCSSRSCLF